MTKQEFISLIGKDVVVDYPFGKELQRWSMKNFYIEDGQIYHNRLPLIIDNHNTIKFFVFVALLTCSLLYATFHY